MALSVGGIAFELSFNESKLTSSINSGCKKIRDSFASSFTNAGNSATKAIETSNKDIIAILENTEKSAKSKAASIAAIYRKEGLSQEEAFRKAWNHIERSSSSGSKNSKKHMQGMSDKSKKVADDIENNLSRGLKNFVLKAGTALVSGFAVK